MVDTVEFGEAADFHHVGVDDVHVALGDEVFDLPTGVTFLAGDDLDVVVSMGWGDGLLLATSGTRRGRVRCGPDSAIIC